MEMDTINPHVPTCRCAVVSEYEAFPAMIESVGLARKCCRVYTKPFAEEVRGLSLITDKLQPELAVYAASVTVVPISLPEDLEHPKAPMELLKKYAGEPQTYVVRGGSMITTRIFDGGPTPASLEFAYNLIKRYNLQGNDLEEIASTLDALLLLERQAGAESEKMLLRIIASERDRRCIAVEAMRRQASGLAPAPGFSHGVPSGTDPVCNACTLSLAGAIPDVVPPPAEPPVIAPAPEAEGKKDPTE